MTATEEVVHRLVDGPGVAFRDVPDLPRHYYAVWLDAPGSRELSAVTPEPVPAGIVYAGQCVAQPLRTHLRHSDIGSLTLMKTLAALFRESWRLTALRRGGSLHEPGRTLLRDWMTAHLTASYVPLDPSVPLRYVLAELDPPLRLFGWRADKTPLRRRIADQRAVLDAAR